MQSWLWDFSFEYSTIVRVDNTLFYFQNTDGFPFATSPEKMWHKKGYIYVFKEYNCLTNTEKELVSSGTMNKVLELLPQESSMYWPDISGSDIFTDTNFSFFGGVLRFVYIIWSAQGGYIAEYNITINTRAIDNATNWQWYVHADAILINGSRYDHGGNDPSKPLYKFSTWAYFHKNESIIPN
jgi:hypothetical protein